MKKLFLLLLISIFQHTCIAQIPTDTTKHASKLNADVEMDILNNYIWRGLPLDKGPCLQPDLFLSYENLKLSIMASYSLKYDFNNILTTLAYDFKTPAGTFSPILSHYYYPYEPVRLTDFRHHDGSVSQTLEAGVQYMGDKIPLRIYTSINVANDPDHSSYFEAGYKFNLNEVSVEPFAGAVFNPSPDWMDANKAGLLNLGLNATKLIKITDKYSLPLTGTLSWQTQLDMINLMVRISIL